MQAAILQRAVDYIDELHRHKQQLVAKNQRLAHLLGAATAAAAAAAAAGSGNGPEVTSSWRWEDGATPGRAAACGVWRRRRAELERRDAAAAAAVDDDDEAEDLRVASVPQSAATLPVDAAAARQSLPPRTVYTYTTTALCPKKRPPFLFFQELCQKLTDLMISGTLNADKIRREHLTDLSSSPVR